MVDCCLLIPLHPMAAFDLHNTVPPPPAPPFPSIYFCAQVLGGLPVVGKAKMAKKTYALSFPTMEKGTDIGRFIVHVGNPVNLELPFIILGSGSKSAFGASSVKIENKIPATACLVLVNLNLNCNFPCNLPNGVVCAPNTAMAGMSIGDYLGGIINMAIDSALSFAIDKLAGAAGDAIGAKIAAKYALREAWKFVIGQVGNTAMKEGLDAFRDQFFNDNIFNTDTDQIGDAIGQAVDEEVNAISAYFDEPSVEEFS